MLTIFDFKKKTKKTTTHAKIHFSIACTATQIPSLFYSIDPATTTKKRRTIITAETATATCNYCRNRYYHFHCHRRHHDHVYHHHHHFHPYPSHPNDDHHHHHHHHRHRHHHQQQQQQHPQHHHKQKYSYDYQCHLFPTPNSHPASDAALKRCLDTPISLLKWPSPEPILPIAKEIVVKVITLMAAETAAAAAAAMGAGFPRDTHNNHNSRCRLDSLILLLDHHKP